jgi:drug/metabolite transporter (DMT)-like permease
MAPDRGRPRDPEWQRVVAVLETLLCALIWGSSFVAVKVVLRYTGPLTIAGIRYFLAFLMLLPWLLRHVPRPRDLMRSHGIRLTLMGLTQYTIANGALFFALRLIPATTSALALCLVPLPVLLFAYVRLKERPHRLQIVGMAGAVGGSVLFLSPGIEISRNPLGWGALLLSILGFSVYPVLVREVARSRAVTTLPLTSIPLGIGGGLLLVLAVFLEGIPSMPLQAWGILLGLAGVNTLLAYLLFTHSLQHLRAAEANIMLNLMPVATALIAWTTLGEQLLPVQIAAMVLVVVGASLAQWRRNTAIRVAEKLP